MPETVLEEKKFKQTVEQKRLGYTDTHTDLETLYKAKPKPQPVDPKDKDAIEM